MAHLIQSFNPSVLLFVQILAFLPCQAKVKFWFKSVTCSLTYRLHPSEWSNDFHLSRPVASCSTPFQLVQSQIFSLSLVSSPPRNRRSATPFLAFWAFKLVKVPFCALENVKFLVLSSLRHCFTMFQRLADHCLSKEILLKSGKFVYLDSLLPSLKEKVCICITVYYSE